MESLPLGRTRWVVGTLPQWKSNRALLHALEAAGHQGPVAAVARDADHARMLAQARVERVINPFDDAADHAARGLAAQMQSKEDVP